MRALVIAVALALGITGGATAETTSVGHISIHDAWARASLGAAPNSAAYMVLETAGEQPDRLVGASSPVAERVELHAHMMDGDIARMRPVDAIEVAPGGATVLQPGGVHLMLVGLKQTLAAGETLPLTLRFEHAGEVTLDVAVRPIGAGAGRGGHGGMHHQGAGGTN